MLWPSPSHAMIIICDFGKTFLFWLHVFGIVKQTTWCRYVFTCFRSCMFQASWYFKTQSNYDSWDPCYWTHVQSITIVQSLLQHVQNQKRISSCSFKTLLWFAMNIQYQVRSLWVWLKITPFKCECWRFFAIHYHMWSVSYPTPNWGRKNMLTKQFSLQNLVLPQKSGSQKRILPHPFPHRSCRWKAQRGPGSPDEMNGATGGMPEPVAS